MTYEEMCNALANHFPRIPATFDYIKSTVSRDWVGYSQAYTVNITNNNANITMSITGSYDTKQYFYIVGQKGYKIEKIQQN